MDPPPGETPLPEVHYRIALGMRLSVRQPLPGGMALCQNYTANGRHCAANCAGDKGQHALPCQYGGLSLDRHDQVTMAIGAWLGSHGFQWKTEQAALEFDNEHRRARLDLCYVDSHWGRTWVDVTLCAASTHDGVSVQQRFKRREVTKHDRYVGGTLVPFVMDPRGSWGQEARTWVTHVIHQIPEEDRGESRRRLRWGVAQALQIAIGEQILASGKPGPPPRPSKNVAANNQKKRG